MATPEPSQNNLWSFFMTLLPWATLYGILHTAIYFVFKYFSDSRDKRLEAIADERIEHKIAPLDKKLTDMDGKIDGLTKMFLERSNK